MKFGRNLHDYRVLLWRHEYIDYDRLKTEIKLVRKRAREGEVLPGDCTPAFKCMSHQIESINQYHKYLSNAIWGEVSKYHVWYSGPKSLEKNPNWEQNIHWEIADEPELHFFMGLLLQCRTDLRRLFWYGSVNSSGFQRILQKFGKLADELAHLDWMDSRIEHFKSMLTGGLFSMHEDSLRKLRRVEFMIEKIHVLSTRSFNSQSSLMVSQPSLMVNNLARIWYPDLMQKGGPVALNLGAACGAIRKDDSDALRIFLEENVDTFIQETINACTQGKDRSHTENKLVLQRRRLVLVLTQLSIIHISKNCLNKLFDLMKSTYDIGFPKSDYTIWVIDGILVKMSHRQLLTGYFESDLSSNTKNSSGSADYLLSLLGRILSGLKDEHSRRTVLFTPDVYWRHFPIHNASRYGLPDACQLFLDHMPLVGKYQFSEPTLEGRFDKCTPLTFAITLGHTEVYEVLVKGFMKIWENAPRGSWITNIRNGEDLVQDIYSCVNTWQALPLYGPFKDYQGAYGETALYAAASSGNYAAVSNLLQKKVNANIPEKSRGWSPLIVASVKGYGSIVELLIESGASEEQRDRLGLKAFEHAASKDHKEIMDILSRQCHGQDTTF